MDSSGGCGLRFARIDRMKDGNRPMYDVRRIEQTPRSLSRDAARCRPGDVVVRRRASWTSARADRDLRQRASP